MPQNGWDAVDVRLAAVQARAGGMDLETVLITFRVGRSTFFEWQRRYRAGGAGGLVPGSRRPHRSPRHTAAEVEDAVLALAKKHPRWGPDKLHARLLRLSGAAPARSTIQQILARRTGRSALRQRPRPRQRWRRFERAEPNDLWQIDATEHALADGRRFWVVDVLDDHSRFMLATQVGTTPSAELAWAAVQHAASIGGLPRQLLSDNGLTFTGRLHGLQVAFERSARAAGIETIYAGPGHPQTLGKDERQHRTQNEWIDDHRPHTLAHAQDVLEAYRQEYNHIRPHWALADAVPADRYRPGDPVQLPGLDLPPPGGPLPAGCVSRKVDINGFVGYAHTKIHIGRRYRGMTIGLRHQGARLTAYYGHTELDTYLVPGLPATRR